MIIIILIRITVSLQRAFEPPEVKHDRLLVISIAGFLVNLVGIFVFHHGGAGESITVYFV